MNRQFSKRRWLVLQISITILLLYMLICACDWSACQKLWASAQIGWWGISAVLFVVHVALGWWNRFSRYYTPQLVRQRFLERLASNFDVTLYQITNFAEFDPAGFVAYTLLLNKRCEGVRGE